MDRLEELVDRGWRPPVGRKVLIDEEMLLNIIDQMRICIPQEIKEATELLAQRDRLLAKAQEQARRIMAQAREEADRMLEEDAVRAQAGADAEAMLREARGHALRVIGGADRYAEEQLGGLERTVGDLQRVIQGGLKALAERRAQREAEKESVPEQPVGVQDGAGDPLDADGADLADESSDVESPDV